MSIHLIDAVFKSHSSLRLDPYERIVMIALANYADADGYCWPSMKQICKISQTNHRATQRIIARLIQKGVLRREPRFKRGGQTSNGWYIDSFVLAQGVSPVHAPHVPAVHPPHVLTDTPLTISIEPSVEPPIAGQKTVPKEIAMKSGVKGISKGTVKVSADEVQTALIDKNKIQGTTDLLDEFVSKKLTAGTLAQFWRRLIALNCPEYGPIAEMKKKELGHLVQLKKYFGEKRVLESIAILVERWIDFTKYAEGYFDAYKSPLLPSLPYMVVNSQAAISYREMQWKVLQPIAKIEQKHHNIVKEVPVKLKSSDEKPMTLEEFEKIEQEHEGGK